MNDIAIIKLSQAVKFNQYVQPACLPDPSYGSYPSSVNISSVYAAGWVSFDKFSFDKIQNNNLN